MKPPSVVPNPTVSRNALVTLAIVASGAALYWLADILTPLAMAIFLLIMIDGVKRAIESRTPVPRRWAGAGGPAGGDRSPSPPRSGSSSTAPGASSRRPTG
jgi:hypothetical protein